ncbi:hypothetical protein BC833DRAFT_602476 [Globomyces pollinis-pini]|nr:hypothetical protein BC833DRAFT_602476 [Globomyces pollinis-pini]
MPIDGDLESFDRQRNPRKERRSLNWNFLYGKRILKLVFFCLLFLSIGLIGFYSFADFKPINKKYLQSNHEKFNREMGGTDRVAVCLVGNPRTFQINPIHQSIYEYVNSISNHSDFFFQFGETVETSCENIPKDYPNTSLEKAIGYFNVTKLSYKEPSCKEPYISSSRCCERKNNPGHWISYQRKVSCYNNVQKHEAKNGFKYDWYIFLRPDLYFLEKSLQHVSLLNKNRMYLGSKEHDQPMGDSLYIVPNGLIETFVTTIATHNDDHCSRGNEPHWSPEFELQPLIHRQQRLPHQMLPILFTIARCDGTADCFRLDNEVLYDAHFLGDDGFLSPKYYCESQVKKMFES